MFSPFAMLAQAVSQTKRLLTRAYAYFHSILNFRQSMPCRKYFCFFSLQVGLVFYIHCGLSSGLSPAPRLAIFSQFTDSQSHIFTNR